MVIMSLFIFDRKRWIHRRSRFFYWWY